MKYLIIILIILIIAKFMPYDSTDNKPKRSGLSLYIDHKTGCHYVKAGFFGSITPRLDEKGKPICSGQEKENKEI